MLEPEYAPSFARDYKRLKRKRFKLSELQEVVDLILENTRESTKELVRRHNMHDLKGAWEGSSECHVANAGDWLLVWRTTDELAIFQRTGTHDEIFR